MLLVAFCLVWWLYQEYKPAPQPVQTPATDVVPPGFVPDPAYTWVPRTNVEEPRRTTTTTTPTTTETTSPTSTTSSTDTTTTGTSTTGTSTTGSSTASADRYRRAACACARHWNVVADIGGARARAIAEPIALTGTALDHRYTGVP